MAVRDYGDRLVVAPPTDGLRRANRGVHLAVVLGLVMLVHVSSPAGADVLLNGSITAADPTQSGRIIRNQVASDCLAAKPNPGPFGDALLRHYDLYDFTAPAGSCVTVSLTVLSGGGPNGLHPVVYSPSFGPALPAQNYLADPGVSALEGGTVSFSFLAPASGSFVLVVHEAQPNVGGSYTLQVTGANVAGPDATPPTCFVSALRAVPPKEMDVTVQDTGSGLAGIFNVQIVNGTVTTNPNPIPPGTTLPVVVTATKSDPTKSTVWSFDAVDVAGNVTHCA